MLPLGQDYEYYSQCDGSFVWSMGVVLGCVWVLPGGCGLPYQGTWLLRVVACSLPPGRVRVHGDHENSSIGCVQVRGILSRHTFFECALPHTEDDG